MRVKICGITCPEDLRAAAEAGADAVGFNFVGGPRCLDPVRAADLLAALPPLVTPVALVRLEEGRVPDALLELLGEFWVSHVQLYGDLTPAALAALARDGLKPIPAIAVREARILRDAGSLVGPESGFTPAAVVLDAWAPGREGGTGRTLAWPMIAAEQAAGHMRGWPPIILAGGLTPENVAEAVRQVRPWAVDVSSGVERADAPGRKDPARMDAFVRQARRALSDA